MLTDAQETGEPYGLLSDTEILARLHTAVFPLVTSQVREENGLPVISYGLSSYGYDVRLANTFRIFSPHAAALQSMAAVDPKNWNDLVMDEVYVCNHAALILPPSTYALGHSLEYFEMPEDITGVCVGKSTYARCGIIVNVTPLEAGWHGYVTIEISNSTTVPVKVYAGEGIMQVLFFRGAPCTTSYASRKGKYQDQEARVVGPRV